MKKIIISLFVGSLFLIGSVNLAQASMMGNYNTGNTTTQQTPAIATALQDIYTSQNITSLAQIDCTKISDDQFEKLGDAYMGYGITEAQHTVMENMMGGEGSATLKQAHIAMGRAYIGCWTNHNMPMSPMMSMMSGSASNYNSRGGMMNWFSVGDGNYGVFSIFHWITMILVWILLGSGIFAIWKYIKGKK